MTLNIDTELEKDMMKLVKTDPDIGFHRSSKYPDMLINPWTGRLKHMRSGELVRGKKIRGVDIREIVWNHHNPSRTLSEGDILIHKDGNRNNNSISNLHVMTARDEDAVVQDSIALLKEMDFSDLSDETYSVN
jgi:hypothetical protein